ncbi:hypothetical protein PybrP1_002386 [[Pythium] brassicae (nom. inval.)]|nr:hypothetical protein PybrP1_002386 [[Pythium] brassicae (nom. inval.)]
MGRFLGASPPSNSGAAGRRYEALPADHDDRDDHSDRESLGAETTSPAEAAAANAASVAATPAITSPVGSGPPLSQRVTRANDTRSDNQEDAVAITIDENSADSSDRSALESKSEAQPEAGSVTPADTAAAEDLGPDAITVRILDLNGKFFSIPCRLDWRVARMKQRVLESTEVAVAAQRLIYRGRVLEDDSCLSDYKVEDGHTIHLFVRHSATPDPEALSAEATVGGAAATAGGARLEDASGLTIVHISNDLISSAVFPSDSARRVDPLMLDSPLGNCARRVKLWSSFLLIIYTMKVMGQFALLANDQQLRSQQQQQQAAVAAAGDSGAAAAAAMAEREREDQRERMYDYPEYYHQDPVAGVVELLIHAFGVYVGGVGFKAAHDTDIRPIRFFCRGLAWLACLTLAEQVFITVQIANSDIPNERIRFAYGAQAPSKDDIVSANVFQGIMLVVMWVIALRHAYWHQAEVNAYNQSFAAAAMNAVPPPRLPPAELA